MSSEGRELGSLCRGNVCNGHVRFVQGVCRRRPNPRDTNDGIKQPRNQKKKIKRSIVEAVVTFVSFTSRLLTAVVTGRLGNRSPNIRSLADGHLGPIDRRISRWYRNETYTVFGVE